MSLDNSIIATRHVIGRLSELHSVAGIAWWPPLLGLRKSVTRLLSSHDPKVALMISQGTDEKGNMLQVSYVYAGRFLDRAIEIGKLDFQIFRFHCNLFDDLVPESDRPRFGEVIGERWDPMKGRTVVLEVEPIWGPRWEDQDLLRACGFGEIPESDAFVTSAGVLAESREEYLKHKSWATHPGVLQEADWADYFEMTDRMANVSARLAVVQ